MGTAVAEEGGADTGVGAVGDRDDLDVLAPVAPVMPSRDRLTGAGFAELAARSTKRVVRFGGRFAMDPTSAIVASATASNAHRRGTAVDRAATTGMERSALRCFAIARAVVTITGRAGTG
jgi:hypothetical protein